MWGGGGHSCISLRSVNLPRCERRHPTVLSFYFNPAFVPAGGVPGRGAPLPGFNAGGRGYPDVSALAFNYIVAVNNNFTAGGRLGLVMVGYRLLCVFCTGMRLMSQLLSRVSHTW
jgi:hypothetical protein